MSDSAILRQLRSRADGVGRGFVHSRHQRGADSPQDSAHPRGLETSDCRGRVKWSAMFPLSMDWCLKKGEIYL